jgi:hypothetical protein
LAAPPASRRLWLQRPLPQELQDYAAADVRYLLPVAAALLSDLRTSAAAGLSTAHAYLMSRPPPALGSANVGAFAALLEPPGRGRDEDAVGAAFELRLGVRGVPCYTLYEPGGTARQRPEGEAPGRGQAPPAAAQQGGPAPACGAGALRVMDEGLASMMALLPMG